MSFDAWFESKHWCSVMISFLCCRLEKNCTRCSKCVPCTWLQSSHRRAIACRTLANMLGLCLIWSSAVNIRSLSYFLVLTGLMYTKLFTCLQRKKSRGVRSGDVGGHATGPPSPYPFLPVDSVQFCFNWWLHCTDWTQNRARKRYCHMFSLNVKRKQMYRKHQG